MARRSQSADGDTTRDFAHPVVALIDPNGNHTHVSTPLDVTNLVYGSGYRVRDFDTVEEAQEFLRDSGGVQPGPQTVEQAVVNPDNG